ncbi:MAG TPA: hemolysin family protein [Vicinamibacterales bacterium]|nr:hemolysin family protein [Vicinamibacterales bacterium]
MTPLLLFLLACVLVYLGTVQAAFSALMRLSLRLEAERSGRGETLGRYLDDPSSFFTAVRVLVGLTVVLVVVLLGGMENAGNGASRVALVVGASLALLVVCELVIPTLIVRRDPERVLDVLLPSFTVVARVVHPLVLPLSKLEDARRDRGAAPAPNGEETPGEAGEASADGGEPDRHIQEDERRLIQSIFEFGDTLVREVMTPRPDIVAVRAETTFAGLRALLKEQTYSRIPVFKESLDNILGIVFVKDLIQLSGDETRTIDSLIRPAYFVPETKNVADLLREFQQQRVQIAVVVDEYGGTAGLVTLEDLIEEIVGEIRDEYDEEAETVTDEGQGVFTFSAKVNIDEVRERLGVEIEREGFETVGGFILSILGRVPLVGEKFDIDGLSVEVLDAERRRVHKVRIRRRQPSVEQEGA